MLSEIFSPERAIATRGFPDAEPDAAHVATCPSVLNPTAAPDGILSRIRVLGGILTEAQIAAIAQVADRLSQGRIQITNRANIQIRGQGAISPDTLAELQALGLASRTAAVDHLRNIMLSPTAGIDAQSLWDPRPVARQWENYLADHPELAVLSAKFSVGFDGGEAASVGDRPNDISLITTTVGDSLQLRLRLSVGDRGTAPQDVGIRLAPEQVLPTLAAFASVYCDYTQQQETARRPPRLRDWLQSVGIEPALQSVAYQLSSPWQRCAVEPPRPVPQRYRHLGHHPQHQSGLSYLGIALPLGRLTSKQLRGIATLAAHHGSGQLRLTPWQNLLIPDLPHACIAQVKAGISRLGLPTQVNHPWGAIVACSGSTGCHSSATDTQADALALAQNLAQSLPTGALPFPLNIHLTGCEKSCAQHHPSGYYAAGSEAGKQGGVSGLCRRSPRALWSNPPVSLHQ